MDMFNYCPKPFPSFLADITTWHWEFPIPRCSTRHRNARAEDHISSILLISSDQLWNTLKKKKSFVFCCELTSLFSFNLFVFCLGFCFCSSVSLRIVTKHVKTSAEFHSPPPPIPRTLTFGVVGSQHLYRINAFRYSLALTADFRLARSPGCLVHHFLNNKHR